MTFKKKLLIAGSAAFLLPLMFTAGQTTGLFITLHVRHNGKAVPSPEQVTLTSRGESLTLPIRGERFEVPSAVLGNKDIRLVANVGGEQVRISGIYGSEFRQDEWTLVLADRRYDSDNQWVVPKGASVRSSCILIFESKSAESTALFEPHCRYELSPRTSR